MRWSSIVLAVLLGATPARAEAPATKPPAPAGPDPVWVKTKIVTCEVLRVDNCRGGGCTAGQKLPSFRIDIAKQTMCALVSGGCKNDLKIGQVGFDRANTRMVLHALGAAFTVGVDADGTMNAADVAKGHVVAIQGRCTPSSP